MTAAEARLRPAVAGRLARRRGLLSILADALTGGAAFLAGFFVAFFVVFVPALLVVLLAALAAAGLAAVFAGFPVRFTGFRAADARFAAGRGVARAALAAAVREATRVGDRRDFRAMAGSFLTLTVFR